MMDDGGVHIFLPVFIYVFKQINPTILTWAHYKLQCNTQFVPPQAKERISVKSAGSVSDAPIT